MKIEKITNIDFETIHKVLTSKQITESQKTSFLLQNRTKITNVIENCITSVDFEILMSNRTLQKFRPLKNSYTKWGDKIILAKALGIQPNEVPSFVRTVASSINKVNKLDFLPIEKKEMIKKYIYRHGSKDELVNFLDWELKQSKDLLKTLYSTFTYYSGGVADYFIRPIHRLDNKTLIKIYNVVCKNIKRLKESGNLSEEHSQKIAKWTFKRIYEIQNNSKLINAIKTYNVLK